MTTFDGVVIGAGHNGLTLAAYLARAGLRIAVLERNQRIGGGCSTDSDRLPGFRLNLHANFYMGMSHCPLIEDLELYRYGFSYIEPPVQQAAAFRDGTCVVIHKDLDKTCASLARFSKQDAETFRELWNTYCVEMRPLLASLLYNAPMPREQLIDRLSGPKAKELLSHAQHDLFSVVRKHFVDERIRTLFTSYMHVITTENVAGAGIVFPAIFANIASFTLPVGGAVSLVNALHARGGSGRRRKSSPAPTSRRSRSRAAAPPASSSPTAASSREPNSSPARSTFRPPCDMAGAELFPEPVREKAKSWHWGNHSLVTLHLALKNAPVYRASAFDPDMARAYNMFFGMDNIDEVASCFDRLRRQEIPQGSDGQRRLQQRSSIRPMRRRPAFGVLVAVRALFGRRRTAGMGAQPQGLQPAHSGLLARFMPPIWQATICSGPICSRRSMSSGSIAICGRARCAWAPMCPISSASIARTRCCPARARRWKGFICAARPRAMAAASTARPVTSRPMRSATTWPCSAAGPRFRRRNGNIDRA